MPPSQPIRLTPRQREILEALARHDTTAQIAEELFISRQTVQWHLRILKSQFGVHSLHRLVVRAIQESVLKIP